MCNTMFCLLSFSFIFTSVCEHYGDLRLMGNDSKSQGIVEICYNSKWGYICDDEWGINEHKVACRQLGFGDSGNHRIANTIVTLLL